MCRFAFLLLFASIVLAHDLWVDREGDYYVLYYGHLYPSKGESRFLEYNPSDVISFKCFSEQGKLKTSSFERTYPVRLKGKCAVVYAQIFSGYWSKTITETKPVPKDKARWVMESWQSYESVKRIYTWSEELKKPLTEDLEIVPTEDPFRVKVGDKITLIVFYKGNPVKNTLVYYEETFIGNTDENGKINVRIRHKGIQVIQASFKLKADGVKADYTVITSSLIFTLR